VTPPCMESLRCSGQSLAEFGHGHRPARDFVLPDRVNLCRMYRNIVVGTDGSETAATAVRHAAELAKLMDATLHIVHAYRIVSTTYLATATSFPTWTDDLEGVNAGIAVEADTVCANAAAGPVRLGVKVETYARASDPADLLVAVAEEIGADLVVVGNRGMSGARRFVLGSVPNKVSHHCPCSLLIVETVPA